MAATLVMPLQCGKPDVRYCAFYAKSMILLSVSHVSPYHEIPISPGGNPAEYCDQDRDAEIVDYLDFSLV